MSQRNARFLACLALSIIALSLPCYALDGIGVSRRAENDDDKLYRRRSLHDGELPCVANHLARTVVMEPSTLANANV